MRFARSFVGVSAVLAVLLVTGCSRPEDQEMIRSLQGQVDELQMSNDDLLTRLNDCLGSLDAQRAAAVALQQQLDSCLRSQAATPTITQPPAPAAAAGWERQGGVDWVTVGGDVLFDPGKVKLKASAHETLRLIARQIQDSYSDREIWIVGHTDSDPIKHSGWKDNLELSLNRAATVHRELTNLGVTPQRLVAGGQGEFNPKAPNSSKDGKAQNRRVQIMAILKPTTQ